MGKIMVSICCTTYNQELYIQDCLNGFLMQKTDFPFEILIHDDASTDRTSAIIREYEAHYPNIIKPIYQTENQYSKNVCIDMILFPRAKGKYIALCEGDDYWTDPCKLQKQVDFLEQHHDYSLCFHNSHVIYDNKKKDSHLFTKLHKNEFTIQDIIENDWFIPTQSIVFSKEKMDYPNWLSYVFGEDLAIQLILSSRGKVYGINEAMGVYRVTNNGVSINQTGAFFTVKIIETMSMFNVYTDFKYNRFIQHRLNRSLNLCDISLLDIPKWHKLFTAGFLRLKLSDLFRTKYNQFKDRFHNLPIRRMK